MCKWRRLPPADVRPLWAAISGLEQLVRSSQQEGVTMSAPSVPDPTNPADQVSVSQSWLDYVGSTVASANGVLGPYIQKLIAGESVQLSAAQVADVTSALAGLVTLEPTTPSS